MGQIRKKTRTTKEINCVRRAEIKEPAPETSAEVRSCRSFHVARATERVEGILFAHLVSFPLQSSTMITLVWVYTLLLLFCTSLAAARDLYKILDSMQTHFLLDKQADLLAVHKSSSDKDIRYAYKRLSRRYHPDKNKDPDAADKFVDIAYGRFFVSHHEHLLKFARVLQHMKFYRTRMYDCLSSYLPFCTAQNTT